MILSVTLRSLYVQVSHLCLTGLPEVAMPYSDMWQDCQITSPHTLRPCYAKLSYRSVDPQTLHGNVHQVDHVPNGPTNSAAITTMLQLRLCGGKPLVAVTRERRYGPSRLRVLGLLQLRYEHDSSAIRARYNILRGVMCFRAIMNMSILSRCCRML